MSKQGFTNFLMTRYGQLAAAGLLLMLAVLMLPNNGQIADAVRRATSTNDVSSAVRPSSSRDVDLLWRRFETGQRLAAPELQRLLSEATRTARVGTLVALAEKLDHAGVTSTSLRTAYDVLAAGRPVVARAFMDMRPDRNIPAHWRLRFALRRATNDPEAALSFLQSAVQTPGLSPPRDIIEAAYELNRPDLIIEAAEHGSIARLDEKLSLDLVRRAANSGRTDLIGRIDLVGSRGWRQDDPWLALRLFPQPGTARMAAARPQSLAPIYQPVVVPNDPIALRSRLLNDANLTTSNRPVIAQQLIEAGFRSDALDVLRIAATGQAPDAPEAARLLYLMGPRPDTAGLAWLRQKATTERSWLPLYLDREVPTVALRFLEARADRDQTETLLLRTQFAAVARDRAAYLEAMESLLDGRVLSLRQISAATALLQPGLPERLSLNLARARAGLGIALPNDRKDLAWAAWNRNDYSETHLQLQHHLKSNPDDGDALRLMANAVSKLHGDAAAKPWLERALVQFSANSRARLDILERLNRQAEALGLVETMRARAQNDRELAIIHSRLLIAAGQAGRARRVLE